MASKRIVKKVIIVIVLLIIFSIILKDQEKTTEIVNNEIFQKDFQLNENVTDNSIEQNFIFIPDTGNQRVQKFTLNGTFLELFGEQEEEFDLYEPIDVEYNNEFVYILYRHSGKIKKFQLNGNYIEEYSNKFDRPSGMCITHNSIFVADTYNQRIVKLDLNGNYILEWGERSEKHPLKFSHNKSDRNPEEGKFRFPVEVACNEKNIFVVDSRNHRIQVFDKNGNYKNSFGSFGMDKTTADISEGQTGFYEKRTYEGIYHEKIEFPHGIAVYEDKVFISEMGNHRIRIYDGNGNFKSFFGSFGKNNGEFKFNNKLWVYNKTLYVADVGNHRVQYFNLDGNYLGQFGHFGRSNGTFNNPSGRRVA